MGLIRMSSPSPPAWHVRPRMTPSACKSHGRSWRWWHVKKPQGLEKGESLAQTDHWRPNTKKDSSIAAKPQQMPHGVASVPLDLGHNTGGNRRETPNRLRFISATPRRTEIWNGNRVTKKNEMYFLCTWICNWDLFTLRHNQLWASVCSSAPLSPGIECTTPGAVPLRSIQGTLNTAYSQPSAPPYCHAQKGTHAHAMHIDRGELSPTYHLNQWLSAL